MNFFADDTIAQAASPPGRSALAVVRISGGGAAGLLAETIPEFVPGPESMRRRVFDAEMALDLSCRPDSGLPSGRQFCPARIVVMPAAKSYTREDMAEIHLPGSPAIVASALRTLVGAGARLAEPGEFTFRAFRDGRISLSQAEGVEEAVRAASEAEKRLALSRLSGQAADLAAAWRNMAIDIASLLEAGLDFPLEELDGDPAATAAELVRELEQSVVPEEEAVSGKPAETAIPRVTLVGLANAGKSSLFNALLGREAALVSDRSSTTRDELRATAEWDGAALILADTPGFAPRDAGAGGMASERAHARLGSGDVACWVVDASRPLDQEGLDFARSLAGKVAVVLHKSDLPAALGLAECLGALDAGRTSLIGCLAASSLAGGGIDEVRKTLGRACREAFPEREWNRREQVELGLALRHCRRAAEELSGTGRTELAAEEIRLALAAFMRFSGDGYTEAALNGIFSRFCLGK